MFMAITLSSISYIIPKKNVQKSLPQLGSPEVVFEYRYPGAEGISPSNPYTVRYPDKISLEKIPPEKIPPEKIPAKKCL